MSAFRGQTVALVFPLCFAVAAGQTKLRTPASPLIPPKLTLEASFADASGDQVLASEEQGALNVHVTNEGGEARNVTLRVRPLVPIKGLVVDSTATLENLRTAQKEALSFVVWATDEVQSGKVSLIVEADDASSLGFASTRVEVMLREAPGPNLVVGKMRVNGRTLGITGVGLKVGKNVLDLEIKNAGTRKARGVVVMPSVTAPFVVLSPARAADIGELLPGEQHRVTVAIEVSQQFPLRSFTMNIHLAEHRQRYRANHDVAIPVLQPKSKRR
jgi:hypothetical protein